MYNIIYCNNLITAYRTSGTKKYIDPDGKNIRVYADVYMYICVSVDVWMCVYISVQSVCVCGCVCLYVRVYLYPAAASWKIQISRRLPRTQDGQPRDVCLSFLYLCSMALGPSDYHSLSYNNGGLRWKMKSVAVSTWTFSTLRITDSLRDGRAR